MRLKAPWPEVVGIFVGGCVDRGEGSSFRNRAHAHNELKNVNEVNPGWLCFRSLKRVGIVVMLSDPDWDGEVIKPSALLIHEYAHLLVPNQGHTPRFYRMLCSLPGHRLHSWDKERQAYKNRNKK